MFRWLSRVGSGRHGRNKTLRTSYRKPPANSLVGEPMISGRKQKGYEKERLFVVAVMNLCTP